MIKGLYEAHLPVKDLERSIPFYEALGLKLYKRYDKVAFFWVKEGESWIGLWECDQVDLPYHPSIRHLAFYVDLEDMKKAICWLKEKGIEIRDEFKLGKEEPGVIPNQAHAMVYFYDPDGNSLELITRLPKEVDQSEKMTLSEWEKKYS